MPNDQRCVLLRSGSRRHRNRAPSILATVVALTALPASSSAQPAAAGIEIHRSQVTGLARFVRPREGKTIAVPMRGAQQRVRPIDFLHEYGHLFGASDPERELSVMQVRTDHIGHTHTTYQQYHQGIRVFSAVLKVHQDARGEVTAANGDFHPIPLTFDTASVVAPDTAVALARLRIGPSDAALESTELVIVDPGWYGDPPLGERLAYHIVLSDPSVPLREAFFVDAHTGELLDQWSMIHTQQGQGSRAVVPGSP
jgi:Zn-dependent metalloprotease